MGVEAEDFEPTNITQQINMQHKQQITFRKSTSQPHYFSHCMLFCHKHFILHNFHFTVYKYTQGLKTDIKTA